MGGEGRVGSGLLGMDAPALAALINGANSNVVLGQLCTPLVF